MAEDISPILAVEEKRRAALDSNDADTLGGLLLEDLVHIHNNGMAEGREAYLDRIRSGTVRYLNLQVSKFTVRRHGQSAIADGQISFDLELPNGSRRTFESHFMQAWVETADGWRLGGYASAPLA
jgi:ketosteroid isomerase-like protein